MRFPGKNPPKTPAERQHKCRDKKRGRLLFCKGVPADKRSPIPSI
jgi:hypothetical protein